MLPGNAALRVRFAGALHLPGVKSRRLSCGSGVSGALPEA